MLDLNFEVLHFLPHKFHCTMQMSVLSLDVHVCVLLAGNRVCAYWLFGKYCSFHVPLLIHFVLCSWRSECVRPFAPELEHVCGRPLGLRFDKTTGDLYIADAYLGLHVVGPGGGLATKLVSEFEGKPLRFTNDLDIDEENDIIYFTDSSTVFQRR